MATVYTVRKHLKTKSVNVGSFDTMDEARAAMIKHFNSTPKRGSFHYFIHEEELRDAGGYILRSTDLSKPCYRYSREMLEAMG